MSQARVLSQISPTARWLTLIGMAILMLVLALPSAHAAAKAKAKTKKFDHDNTGFVLSGAHIKLACDTCHIRGIFKGIPKTCEGCHSQVSQITATKKTDNHIKSTNRCDDCHVDAAWKPVKVDHTAVFGVCNDCHYDNSRIASSRPTTNHPGGTDCQNCHRTSTWQTSGFNHEGITNKCDSCHNGVTVKSQKPNDVVHANVTAVSSCENCHKSFTTWPPSVFDHGYIATTQCVNCHKPGLTPSHTSRPATTASGAAHPNDDNCANCHKSYSSWNTADPHVGVTGGCGASNCHAAKKPADVVHSNVSTVMVCENCHNSFTAWPPTTPFNHAYIASPQCVNCHKPGATPPHTTRPVTTSAGATHPVDDNCQNCHTNTTSWKVGNFDHSGIVNNCVSCHLSKKPTDTEHSNFTSSSVCENCHKSFTTWPLTTLDHTLVSTTHCVTCHSPGHKTTTVRPVLEANGTTHPVDDNCENCHSSAGLTWSGALGKPSNHDTLTSGCSGCHTKDKPATHIPTANNNCENCHRPNQAAFKPWLTWTHSSIQTSSYGCYQCHDGTHPDTTGRSNKHIAITGTSGCSNCHKTTTAWTVSAVDHSQTSGTCVSCHKPNNPPVKTSKASDTRAGGHIVVSDDCAACHKNQNPGGWATHIMDHNQLTGGSSSCATVGCHDTVKATVNHFPTTPSNAECGPTCHSPSLPDWSNAKYAHDGNSDCNSCHGRAKTYKGVKTDAATFDPNHMTNLESLSPVLQCSDCHSGTSTFAGTVSYNFSKHKAIIATELSGHSSSCSGCHRSASPSSTMALTGSCTAQTTCTKCHKPQAGNYSATNPTAHKNAGVNATMCNQNTCYGSGCHSHNNNGGAITGG